MHLNSVLLVISVQFRFLDFQVLSHGRYVCLPKQAFVLYLHFRTATSLYPFCHQRKNDECTFSLLKMGGFSFLDPARSACLPACLPGFANGVENEFT